MEHLFKVMNKLFIEKAHPQEITEEDLELFDKALQDLDEIKEQIQLIRDVAAVSVKLNEGDMSAIKDLLPLIERLQKFGGFSLGVGTKKSKPSQDH